MITMAAHAAGLECWGLAAGIGNIDDTVAYAALARAAREIRLPGAMSIHPRQVAILNEAFSPSSGEIAWARRVPTLRHHCRPSIGGISMAVISSSGCRMLVR